MKGMEKAQEGARDMEGNQYTGKLVVRGPPPTLASQGIDKNLAATLELRNSSGPCSCGGDGQEN
jgi:hypothetical protein